MPTESFVLPFLSKKATVRDLTIKVLSSTKSLNGRDLYQKILQENGRVISYQALYKTLTQLVESEVIQQIGKNYELNPIWVKSLKDYATTVEYVYANDSTKISIPSDLTVPISIEFNDLTNLPVTLAELLASHVFTAGKATPAYGLMYHALWALRFNFHDFLMLKKMVDMNPGSKCAVFSNTSFDQWVVRHYRSVGMIAKSGVLVDAPESDIMVHGDIIIQIYYSPETKKLQNDLYPKINDIADLFNFYIHNKINEQEVKIKVVIQKNQPLAKLFKEKIDSLLAEPSVVKQ